MDYSDYLKTKQRRVESVGIDAVELPERLWDWQRRLVTWALGKGRAALWTDTGTGKSIMQCSWAKEVSRQGRVLILSPLAVAQQTVREAVTIGLEVHHSRDGTLSDGVTITNYEQMAKFDERKLVGIVLDESGILKSLAGKTRTMLIEKFGNVKYRLACTATPSPNDLMELGNHAEFIGVCSQQEMLAEYFVHDTSGGTNAWRLKGHASDDFWAWLASWAMTMRKPSDIGYSDGGYNLPPLNTHHHIVKTNHDPTATGVLFAADVTDLSSRRKARSDSIDARVDKCAELVNSSDEPWLVWCDLNAESDALAKAIPDAVEVRGSQDHEEKERRLVSFCEGKSRVLVTKSKVAGFGLNLQHCCNMVHVGLSDSYEAYYQSVRRCWRYGQKHPVDSHIITSDREGAVLHNIERKAQTADKLHNGMIEASRNELRCNDARKREYNTDHVSGEGWDLHLGDSVELIRDVPDDTVGYSIFSPPFASLYTYSDSDRDMGNCRSHEEFLEHFDFLISQLLRVTKPGRLLSFHCMNLPQTIVRNGQIGVTDFRGMLIAAFVKAGWIYHSEVCIWKDPVTAMQRTKAIGLLYKQLKKDSSLSRQGFPDYLVTVRKPGKNPDPITHTEDEFELDYWQQYASPVWMDINQTRTLQYRTARESGDERHVCPLQLGVIERGIDLWSGPGDLVLSPFAGIGSEGFVALKKQRRFIGFELKRSYYDVAQKNLKEACTSTSTQMEMFA